MHILLAMCLNKLRIGQNGCQFADDISKCIFFNENCFILIKISLKFAPKGLIDNKSALVQVMALCQTGTKPLPEPMLTRLHYTIWKSVGHIHAY